MARLNDDALILALACGANVEAAAKKAGMSRRTVTRRMQDPIFRRKVDEKRGELLYRTAAMLNAGCGEAVKTLLGLQQGSAPPTVRLGAAKAILEQAIRLKEVVDLEQRIAAIEARMTGPD
jgi:hypothetical protein